MICFHKHVTLKWKLYACETRYSPAEYTGRATCIDCEEEFEPEDIPEDAEVEEE
jgi:hypothetical protein